MFDNITRERLAEILENLISWAVEHDDEFIECFIYNMDLTEDEVKEFELEEYINGEEHYE